MKNNMRSIEINPRLGLFILFAITLIAYSLFQARFIILGPRISIESPRDGQSVDSAVVNMVGRADNIAYISINDRPIFVDEKGNFNEKLIAQAGLSILTVRARDRFGRETEKAIRVVYNK